MQIERKASPPINADSLLSGGLLALLLFGYVCTVYFAFVAVVVAVLDMGDLRSPDFLPPWPLNLAALLLVAATFLPVMRLLRRRVNGLVYAEHDDVWAKVSQIIQPLELAADPGNTLPHLAQAIAVQLHVPHVTIELDVTEPPQRAEHGRPVENALTVRLPIRHRENTLGAIEASGRVAGQALSSADLSLLRDVARQIGVAFHATWLAATLQATRENLVLAREEERRRIRNDLHDGLAPTLASLQLQLGAARLRLRQEPSQAEAMLEEMREDLRTATSAIRQLVYGLRPPLLDELGLVGAIRNLRLNGSGLRLDVHAPEPMPSLPAAVEVAAWRIASEAIQNVVVHAQATCCVVALDMDGASLHLRICDDGIGIPEEVAHGVGMQSMRERAAELGGDLTVKERSVGGTEVCARLPFAPRP